MQSALERLAAISFAHLQLRHDIEPEQLAYGITFNRQGCVISRPIGLEFQIQSAHAEGDRISVAADSFSLWIDLPPHGGKTDPPTVDLTLSNGGRRGVLSAVTLGTRLTRDPVSFANPGSGGWILFCLTDFVEGFLGLDLEAGRGEMSPSLAAYSRRIIRR